MVARKKQMPLDEADPGPPAEEEISRPSTTSIANYQPIFLIDQMIAICEFEGIPYQMSPELIDRAWANMFVQRRRDRPLSSRQVSFGAAHARLDLRP